MDQPRSLRAARMPSLFIVESELLLPLVVAASLPLLLALGDVALVLSGAVVAPGAVLVELLGEVDIVSAGLPLVLGDDCGVRVLCDGTVDDVELELSVVDCAYT